MSDYPNISDAPFWTNLGFEAESDDKMLFIEIWCAISAGSKSRFTKDSTVGTSEYVDDAWEGKADYLHSLFRSDDGTHFNIARQEQVIEDFLALSEKYGKEHFINFIQSLYDNYPKPDSFNDPLDYFDSLNASNVFHMKWALIYDELYYITEFIRIHND